MAVKVKDVFHRVETDLNRNGLRNCTTGEDDMRSGGRTSIIRSLLPERPARLLDVGCGPITADYPFADKAQSVTCIDWNLKTPNLLPSNVECVNADFTSIDLAPDAYDSVIAADVFEHILLEQEPVFVSKCISALRPGGSMVISVPHQGTFAYLDPYQVKPAIHRILAFFGLYKSVHNGCCDIRKGHKHYSLEELVYKFSPLQVSKVVYFGYFFDPLFSWAVALSRGSRHLPGIAWLQRALRKELDRDYGRRSFNIAVSFYKL
jgi:2-polyprenyl-3-methyl-5-hydroxy-6-metoxy-1,4-benzoquinol methylase